ncbi:RNA polymerase sigma factor [Pedobacter nutrimenti]|uniref:RNA polymerase sigma-70 factor (ECF subfamily) n=1 Tax=Pedobacter nutrimenti TaxID=1241337 RepID=A0A318UGE7_9SPHI|nr:RNA polymerase sigma-70 factor [Pedobacter nutrimenti]PYF74560.1 RNA polymerase sigma-70 factor (ECF subfamily) [Pedobacter nutrimenti]
MSGYHALSDFELITLLKEGDHVAYTEIYKRYYYLMFVFAYKKLRDEDLAKDVVQELFFQVWQKKETISTGTKFAAFMYVSLRHKIFNYFIHQKVEARYIYFLKDFSNTISSEKADYLVRSKELRVYIEKQIKALPSKMRIIFELSRNENFSHKEIAEKLETSEYNVSKQITNALKILRTKLGVIIFNILFINFLI